MQIYVLGICGTFMAGVALIARQLGHQVAGCDAGAYPPMSELLEESGVVIDAGYDPAHLDPPPDLALVGNALSRGNPIIEHLLSRDIPYASGPEWLGREALRGRWVMAVAGTHGKTTTSSMLAWILECAGHSPGFLIGGVPGNFSASARLTESPFFVIEADEYDTAFFDKRSKFVHYRPLTLVLNNLEFDHADIFDDLAAIQRQFHHLVRTVPGTGVILSPTTDKALNETLKMGCWSQRQSFALRGRADWRARLLSPDGARFKVSGPDAAEAEVEWSLCGEHNVCNALAAIAAASHAGVAVTEAARALGNFENARRRMQLLEQVGEVRVYDDFAHHPTAIRLTLEGLRRRLELDGEASRIVAVLEPSSNTMAAGHHKERLKDATAAADRVFWHCPESADWNMARWLKRADTSVHANLDELLAQLLAQTAAGDHIVLMSNGGFGDLRQRLPRQLRSMRLR